MGFVAAYLRAQVGLVIFRDLAGYGGGAGPHDGVDQVAADGVDLVAGNAVGLLAGHSRALIAIDFRGLAAVGFVHGTLHGFSLVTADRIGLILGYHSSLVATNVRALVAINGSCLAAVLLGYRALDSFVLAAADIIGLVTGYDGSLVAAYRGLLVCLDVGLQGIEVFSFCSLHIDFPVFRYRNRLVSSYHMGFIAAHLGGEVNLVIFRHVTGYGSVAGTHDGVEQVAPHLVFQVAGYVIEEFAAHGVRHVTGCGVHQGLSRIGDGSISCAVGDITGRRVLDIFGIGCYGLIRCRVRDAAFRPSGEDVVSKCGLHVGGIDENFVGTDLICHAGRACVGDGSSVICEDLARCHVGNTGVIHHALHCRTVADLRRHRLTGRAGDGLCLIRHRFSSLIGNRPGIIRDGAIRSEVADIAIRGRIGDTLCSRIRQVLSCIGNRTICRHVGNVAICRSIGDVIRGCIGNCVAGRVDELVGIVRNGAVLGRIRQIRRGLRRRRGVFAVLDLAGDVIRFLVELRILRVTRVDLVENLADVLLEGRTQALFVGEDTAAFRGTLRCSVLVVIRIDSGGRDAISLYRQIALLPAIVCSRRFCPSGRAVCIVIKRTFLLAAVFGVRGFLIACDFTSCDFRAGRDVVVANDAILRQVDFINVEFALDRQIAADFCIAFCHQFAANLSIARCLQRSCLHSTSRLDGAAACIEAINRCGSGFQCSLDFRIAIYRCISGGMKSSRFHRSSGFDSTCTGINPCSNYFSTGIHCKCISRCSQCTCAELSTNRSVICYSQ